MSNELLEINKKISLTPICGIFDRNTLIFLDRYFGGIWSYDLNEEAISYLGKCVGKNVFNMATEILRVDDNLYFVPFNAEKMACYDMQESKLKYYDLPNVIAKYQDIFFCGVVYHRMIILLGYYNNLIYCFDIEKERFEDLNIKKNTDNLVDKMYIRSAVCINDIIYAVSIKYNSIFLINMKNRTVIEKKLKAPNDGYVNICSYKNQLILTPFSGDCFVRYDIKSDKETYINCNLGSGTWAYYSSIIWDNYLIASPCYGLYFVKINFVDNSFIYYEKKNNITNAELKEYACGAIFVHNNQGLIPFLNKGEIVGFDMRYMNDLENKLDLKTLYIPKVSNNVIVHENNGYTVKTYIRTL